MNRYLEEYDRIAGMPEEVRKFVTEMCVDMDDVVTTVQESIKRQNQLDAQVRHYQEQLFKVQTHITELLHFALPNINFTVLEKEDEYE